MTSPNLLHAGFDGLDIAFQGCLPEDVLETLEAAKNEAEEFQRPVPVVFGRGDFEAHVHEKGRKGGYRYHLTTGPDGAIYWFKRNGDPRNWNIFVSATSAMLLQFGYEGTKERILGDLTDMAALVGKESVNRVDFAMDFRMPSDFELRVENFVAHPHAKVKPHLERPDDTPDDIFLKPLYQGRKVRTVTIGMMPGRQVIVYDKRRDVIAKKKLYWFDVWKVDRHDEEAAIWRIEVRAGKYHLKEQWNLSTFEDVEAAFGDVAQTALEKVRYLTRDHTNDPSNISRAECHSLWKAAQEAAKRSLTEYTSGMADGHIKEVYREQQIETYKSLVVSNALGLSVANDMPEDRLEEDLPKYISELIAHKFAKDRAAVDMKLARTRKKYRFVSAPHPEGPIEFSK